MSKKTKKVEKIEQEKKKVKPAELPEQDATAEAADELSDDLMETVSQGAGGSTTNCAECATGEGHARRGKPEVGGRPEPTCFIRVRD